MVSCVGKEIIKQFRCSFYEDKINVLAQNVCSKNDPFEVCISRKHLETNQHHVFTHKIENEGKPVTNQRQSGRCWIFAALNVIRIPIIKEYNLDDFEFSQSYVFFWDKIERCNYFLNTIVKTARRGETVDGRLISFLLTDPCSDGGQWDMLVNLINKHGLMPKKCFPESYSAEGSLKMNAILKSKLREYAKELHCMASCTNELIQKKIQEQMGHIFRVVGICLGIPDETFTWEYYDKKKVYHSIGPITPEAFYKEYVKPFFNMDDKACLVTDPRETNEYNRAYTVDCLGNMIGGRPTIYNNQPVELLLELVAKSIQEGEAVWFGCDVGKRYNLKLGIDDLNLHDFNLVFGTDVQNILTKGERLAYGESSMTHAMVFTAVSLDKDGCVTKLRVENSWGDDKGNRGYIIMTADWFREFGYEIVVDKKFLQPSVLEVFQQEPILLPAWDPMGNLAR